MKILVINGPNLNLLGIREPEIYGGNTYSDLVQMVTDYAVTRGVGVQFYQSNHEGDLVDAIQRAYFDNLDGIVINPGAYTHTSVAILDAAKAVNIPTVEVHISDVSSREDFRQISYIRQVAKATISGKGFAGYNEAIDILIEGIKNKKWK
ncbi:MAG: type II 3-dehydroquinate dehydratase [Clostridia bacterium]|nr:type II 3-dehydroquinate dehydratase [Clostridia bacterium]